MATATSNGTVITESDKYEILEGNFYFPPKAIKKEYFKDSSTPTACSWKGKVRYHTVEVGDKANSDASWYFPTPLDAAKKIRDRVAFWTRAEVKE